MKEGRRKRIERKGKNLFHEGWPNLLSQCFKLLMKTNRTNGPLGSTDHMKRAEAQNQPWEKLNSWNNRPGLSIVRCRGQIQWRFWNNSFIYFWRLDYLTIFVSWFLYTQIYFYTELVFIFFLLSFLSLFPSLSLPFFLFLTSIFFCRSRAYGMA